MTYSSTPRGEQLFSCSRTALRGHLVEQTVLAIRTNINMIDQVDDPIFIEKISDSARQKPRRIAFCITDLDPGGAEKALFNIVTRLDRNEWEPIVFCLGPEAELAPRFREHGIVTLCYGARSSWNWGVLFWLVKELRYYKPLLLQCFLFHANIVGRIAARVAGIPVVLAGHRVAEREKKWHLWLERLSRGLVGHHVCVSQGVADHLISRTHLKPAEVSVIPNGISTLEFSTNPVNIRSVLGWPEDSLIILAVGRLHPQKGFQRLIQDFHDLQPHPPEARLLIVGEGPERKSLQEQLNRLRLNDRVKLIGYRKDVPDLIRQAQVLAISSEWEGMSNVLLEAIAIGLPVITTPTEGVTDVNELSDKIIITRDLKRGLEEFLASCFEAAESRPTNNYKAKPHIEKELTWENASERYSSLYRRLLADHMKR